MRTLCRPQDAYSKPRNAIPNDQTTHTAENRQLSYPRLNGKQRALVVIAGRQRQPAAQSRGRAGGTMLANQKITLRNRLGFIGLGYLGSRMARRLVAPGFPMAVYVCHHAK